MAYDAELADRIRGTMSGVEGVQEKAMFGGLAFLVNGHMALAAGGGGALMVRIDPAEGAALTSRQGVAPMEMKGRPMTGWLLVQSDAVEDDTQLQEWADRAVAFVAKLPPKPPKRPTKK